MTAPCFLFPGQGSQTLGMAKTFYDESKEVKDLFAEASDISKYDIAKLCFSGPMEVLTETKHLQPAMTTAVLACYYGIRDFDVIPSYVAGHSLGEYAALAAAEVIDVSDCLKLVTARGRLMQEQAEINQGAMTAIVKVKPEPAVELVNKIAQSKPLLIANYNSPKQLVASGSVDAIEQLEKEIRTLGGRCIRLNVSGAWHSPLMKAAVEPLAEVIEQVEFNNAKIPIALNVTGSIESDGATIKKRMKDQMYSSVRWYQGIHEIWKKGIRVYIEIGPKGVLTKMMKAISPDPVNMQALFIDSVSALDSFLHAEEEY
ncbi:MAG: [acyl-carrier-protein] S-malonyltransferase [Acidobacteria bacterium]|nr:MAG: [acyl-carrier-protein] S-malonyltransferase [Acidobacteriota bacterium]